MVPCCTPWPHQAVQRNLFLLLAGVGQCSFCFVSEHHCRTYHCRPTTHSRGCKGHQSLFKIIIRRSTIFFFKSYLQCCQVPEYVLRRKRSMTISFLSFYFQKQSKKHEIWGKFLGVGPEMCCACSLVQYKPICFWGLASFDSKMRYDASWCDVIWFDVIWRDLM